MKTRLSFLAALMLSISATGWAGYSFDFAVDFSGKGPVFVKVEDSLTEKEIAQWKQLAGEIGPHLNISMFSDETPQFLDTFELIFTCSTNARFDTSGLVFNDPYEGYYQFLAPNRLIVGGYYRSTSTPSTSHQVFSGLQAVPEPATLLLLSAGGLLLRKRNRC